MLIGDSYRKIFHTSESWCSIQGHSYIFEGIGSNAGPFTNLGAYLSWLNCYNWFGEVYVAQFYQENSNELVSGECLYISVSDLSSEELKVSPNPATDFISLQYPGKSNISTVQIVDLNGRILRETNGSQMNESIDISEYPNGIYIVRLIGKDSVAYAKFMIEK